MADSFISKLITELTARTTAADTDLVPVADSNGIFFKMTWQKMKQLLLGTKDISGVGDGTVTGAISELNTNLPIYSGLGTFDLSVKIPTDTGYYVLINYGQTTLRYIDGSRLEAIVALKTPYPDGSHSTFAFPFWDTQKNILSCNNQNGSKIILECIGDSYSSGKTLAASYFTIGYLPKG